MKTSTEIAEELANKLFNKGSIDLYRRQDAVPLLTLAIDTASRQGERNYIKSKLLQSEEIRLEGGNMDFFFVLNNDLEEQNNIKEGK